MLQIEDKNWEGHPGTRPESPAFGPSVAPPEIFVRIRSLDFEVAVTTAPREAICRSRDVSRSIVPANYSDKPAPLQRAPRNGLPNDSCLRRRVSVASLMPSSGCGQPVTTTGVALQTSTNVDTRSHQRTSLSADHTRCQAHFFITTFCIAVPLAEFVARCSAQCLRHELHGHNRTFMPRNKMRGTLIITNSPLI